MSKKRVRFDVAALPLAKRQEIARANPQVDPRLFGIVPHESPQSPKKKSRRSKKAWRGTIYFDSETEATVYDQLCAESVAVIAHGCIALGVERHVEPDFIQVVEVRPDGSFVGRLVDAKGVWKNGRPHVEDDAAVKYDWLKDRHGLVVDIRTKAPIATEPDAE